jgi:hypothetical protein
MRKFDGFWLKAAGLTDISLIVPGFFSRFKALPTDAGGIDEACAITDCPAKSIGSFL